MMIGIGLVGYEESRPLKAAIGKLARCRDNGFAVTLATVLRGYDTGYLSDPDVLRLSAPQHPVQGRGGDRDFRGLGLVSSRS